MLSLTESCVNLLKPRNGEDEFFAILNILSDWIALEINRFEFFILFHVVYALPLADLIIIQPQFL